MYLQLLVIFFTSAYSASITSEENHGGPYICYECTASGCKNPYNKTCDGAVSCFTSIEIIDKKYQLPQKGCITHPFVIISRCKNRNATTEVSNCCDGDFCNDDEFPNIPDHWTPSPEIKDRQLDVEKINLIRVVFSLYVSPVIAVLALAGLVCWVSIRRIASNKTRNLPKCYDKPTPNATFDNILSSGSSTTSLLTLKQRCLAQDTTLIKCIGQGRYGEVWQGVRHGENVAVKTFLTKDEDSWQNEVNIYTNIALYHENVLGFKGSVITTRFDVTEMWLLTAFHEQGSLYDYLLENTFTHNEMIEFVRSICSGLLHLHTEIFGSKGKPAIAHRDLKTRNILLTSHGSCVIADFGLAVVKSETSSTNMPVNYRVGTKRYMAPEILDESMKINSFDSFKRADIYAFGLVLWEVCSRCITGGTAEAYRPPFHDCVPNNPDFEDMKKVVCIELKRPEIPDSWSSDKPLNAMATLMKECWHKNPEIRSTVCRAKKTLDKIHAEMQELQSTAQSV
ncbi:Activin receptor type-1 [Araneus ventricosus]|uniref:receptor protein serine/threonine kinase n=1 Tax=Araneus ventricosus TaxID=182803 RepID=A0A4Y2DS26_ARAVE|nr:Activin receptor type-1 [Araneus ventricosus]